MTKLYRKIEPMPKYRLRNNRNISSKTIKLTEHVLRNLISKFYKFVRNVINSVNYSPSLSSRRSEIQTDTVSRYCYELIPADILVPDTTILRSYFI